VSAPLRQDIRSNAYDINVMMSIQKGIQMYLDKILVAMDSAETCRKVKMGQVYYASRNLLQKILSINIGQLPLGLAIGVCLKELGTGSRNRFLKVSSRSGSLFRLRLDTVISHS